MIRIWTFLCLLCLVSIVAGTGCDTSGAGKSTSLTSKKSQESVGPQSSDAAAVVAAASARSILDASFAKYKSLKSYEDRGVLKVRYPTNGTPFEGIEPMQIAFESPNRLAMKSIGLQSMWTELTWEAMFSSQRGSPFGKQRVVRPRPEKVDLRWLIVDNLGDLLDNRILGPPIQLELLFEDKPLPNLADPNITLSLKSPEMFDSVMCDRIQIATANSKWTLWIDQKEKLLRKYELPTELIYSLNPELPAGLDASKMELSIELIGAKADTNIVWSDWEIPRKDDDLLVSRFVDAPQRDIHAQLGKILPAFDLKNADGKIILDSSERSKPITVLCWVGTDELSGNFVKYAIEVYRDLNSRSLTNTVELMFVSTAPAAEIQEAFRRWNCDLPLAIDTENLTGKSFGISRQPAIVVLDKQGMVQHIDEVGYLERLPDILVALKNGVNIAARAIQDYIDNEARFVSRLHRAVVEKSQAEQLAPVEPFPLVYHEMQSAWKTSLDTKVIAAAGEPFLPQSNPTWRAEDVYAVDASRSRVMTFLDEMGDVYVVDSLGGKQLVAKIPSEKADNAKRIHILPDPWTHRWIAIVPEGLPRFWLFEMPVQMTTTPGDMPAEPTEFSLEDSESAIAFAWTVQGTRPSLSIATSSGKLHVLDPERAKVRKGQTSGVVAILPTLNARGECMAWNAVDSNGVLSPIDNLPTDSPSPDAANDLEGTIKKLPFLPEPGAWTWGRNRNESLMVGLSKLPSGEAGAVLYSNRLETIFTHPLSVRAEQCRIVASTSLANGIFYWLSTAPRRVLHLQTKDGAVPDQMSLGKPILGAALFPEDNDLRMILCIDNEVSSWRLRIPTPPAPPESIKPTESASPSGAVSPSGGASGAEKSGV
jgi:hypothetical protein